MHSLHFPVTSHPALATMLSHGLHVFASALWTAAIFHAGSHKRSLGEYDAEKAKKKHFQ
jgi:hypothetical protein